MTRSPEEAVARLLSARRQTLAVAESCTGGLLGGALTRVPGASRWFLGGVVAYADEAKVRLLGVAPETLRQAGAVSAPCAREMARGARRTFGADVALSVTGVAGPGGGSREKPVGRVYLALDDGSSPRARKLDLGGDREAVRAQAVSLACEWLVEQLEGGR